MATVYFLFLFKDPNNLWNEASLQRQRIKNQRFTLNNRVTVNYSYDERLVAGINGVTQMTNKCNGRSVTQAVQHLPVDIKNLQA